MAINRLVNFRLALGLLAALLFVAVGLLHFISASGAEVSSRYLQVSNNQPGAKSMYTVGFDVVTSGVIGSLEIQFCSNAPLVGTPCVAPNGFDVSGASLGAQIGVSGYSISNATTANDLILTRMPFNVNPVATRLDIKNVINPDTAGSYYARIQTFSSTDASGSHTDFGGVAYSINEPINISTTVPPYLLFCSGLTITGADCSTASGDYINFGDLNTTLTKTGTSQLLTATNGDGYSVTVSGTTMISGINIIPSISSTDVSRPGTSQFGLNLRANSTPSVGANVSGPGSGVVAAGYNVPNRFKFVPGDVIASSLTTDYYRKYTISYIVNISKHQQPGVYVSTLTYIAIANF